VPFERSGVPPEGGRANCLVRRWGRGPGRWAVSYLKRVLGSFAFCFLRKKVGFPWLFRGPLWLSPTEVIVAESESFYHLQIKMVKSLHRIRRTTFSALNRSVHFRESLHKISRESLFPENCLAKRPTLKRQIFPRTKQGQKYTSRSQKTSPIGLLLQVDEWDLNKLGLFLARKDPQMLRLFDVY
jgi:hypothetical protein